MGGMSREKGKRGERDCAEFIRRWGFEAKRGVQHQGGNDSPDVKHSMDGIHIEVKRCEKINIEASLKQAAEDAKPGDLPIVFHRKNGKRWVMLIDAEKGMDFLSKNLYTE